MPVVLLMVMLVVQFGLWMHARHVVSAAAQEGLFIAQRESGSVASGRERAEVLLTGTGGTHDTIVEVTRDAFTASVSVRGLAPAVLPGMQFSVSAVAEGPVERFVGEAGR